MLAAQMGSAIIVGVVPLVCSAALAVVEESLSVLVDGHEDSLLVAMRPDVMSSQLMFTSEAVRLFVTVRTFDLVWDVPSGRHPFDGNFVILTLR